MAQRRKLFIADFGDLAADANVNVRLDLMEGLTTGDFKSVAKRAKVLDLDQQSEILDELDREHAAKPGTPRMIGFGFG
jgi:hypothetical protein